MTAAATWLDRVFFPVISPVRLAVARICTGLYACQYILSYGDILLKSAGGAPETFSPVGLAHLLDGPIAPTSYRACMVATQLLSVAFVTGLWFRVTGPLFAVLLLFVLSYSNSWSMVFHTENMLVLHVLVLAFTPSAAALSFDTWDRTSSRTSAWSRLEGAVSATPDQTPRWIYGWSILMMQLVATLPYVVAGLAKVLGKAGIAWALGHSLRDQITMNGIYYETLMGGAGEITFHVYGYETAFLVAASLTLVLELGAPLAILHRYVGYLFVAGIVGMHFSILVLMGIPFPYQLCGAAFACFFEWERLEQPLRRVGRRFSRLAPRNET